METKETVLMELHRCTQSVLMVDIQGAEEKDRALRDLFSHVSGVLDAPQKRADFASGGEQTLKILDGLARAFHADKGVDRCHPAVAAFQSVNFVGDLAHGGLLSVDPKEPFAVAIFDHINGSERYTPEQRTQILSTPYLIKDLIDAGLCASDAYREIFLRSDYNAAEKRQIMMAMGTYEIFKNHGFLDVHLEWHVEANRPREVPLFPVVLKEAAL